MRRIAHLMNQPAIRKLNITVHYPALNFTQPPATDGFYEEFVRHTAATVYHHSGTAKMGAANDATAVLDTELRVRGVHGLRVVDCSAFPLIPGANTNAPVIALAERAADLIKQAHAA